MSASPVLIPNSISPLPLAREIDRENICQTMTTILEGDTSVLLLFGREGMGKTTLLSQFARSNASRTVAIFLSTSSRFGYDPFLVESDIRQQICQLVYRRDADERELALGLSAMFYELQRHVRRTKQTVYFVIDGLDEIPTEDQSQRQAIVDLLPFGLPQFRFVLSSEDKHLPELTKPLKGPPQALPLSPLSINDVFAYYGSLATREQIEQLYKVSKGKPSLLAAFLRRLDSGVTVEVLLSELPDFLEPEFEIEWKTLDPKDEVSRFAVAILAQDQNPHSLKSLAAMVKVPIVELQRKLELLTFVDLPQQADANITFVSDAYRRFADRRSPAYRQRVLLAAIEALESQPEETATLQLLPRYLLESKQDDRLLNYLTPEHFALILERTGSVLSIRDQASLGKATAMRSKRDGDLLRFALQESCVTELNSVDISRAEIKARVAVGDHASALRLATSAMVSTDRLQLLAAFCSARKKQGTQPEPEVLDQLNELLKRISAKDLGDKAEELAADLISFAPAEAIDVIERLSEAPSGSSTDHAFARLSLIGVARDNIETDSASLLREKIKDPHLARVAATVSVILGQYEADAIIHEAEQLANISDRLFLLRSWAANTRDRSAAPRVVRYALETAVKNIEYVPNPLHYRELLTPLPGSPITEDTSAIVRMIESQQVLLERRGPSEEYVAMQLLLAEIEFLRDVSAGSTKLLEVYFYVQECEDLITRASCLARLIRTLAICDPTEELAASGYAIRSQTVSEFQNAFRSILAQTADQNFAFSRIFDTLASTQMPLALTIAGMLNTEDARDEATVRIIEHHLESPIDRVHFDELSVALDALQDRDLVDDCLETIAKRIAAVQKDHLSTPVLAGVKQLLTRASNIGDLVKRVATLGFFAASFLRSSEGEAKKLGSSLALKLGSLIDDIGDEWIKIEISYKLAQAFAKSDRPLAISLLDRANTAKNTMQVQENSSSYVLSLRLVNRAIAALASAQALTAADVGQVVERILTVQSKKEQIRLLADLAVRLFSKNRNLEAERIINQHVKPMLVRVRASDPGEWARLVYEAAAPIYKAHPLVGSELLLELPQPWRDLALDSVMDFILQNTASGDPHTNKQQLYLLTYPQAEEICRLLLSVEDDNIIHHHIRVLVDSILWSKNKHQLSAEQKKELARTLSEIALTQLPAKNCILHDGYQIASLALLEKVERRPGEWVKLIARANAIPNTADKVMVLCLIAENAETLGTAERVKLFEDARDTALTLPSKLDRADRLEIIAQGAERIAPAISNEALKTAMTLAASGSGIAMQRVQKRIVDTAYQINENLATSLVGALDNDTARKSALARARYQLQQNQLREGFLNTKKPAAEVLATAQSDNRAICDAAWSSLGSLNANRAEPQDYRNIREYLHRASVMPLHLAYPIFAWAIESFGRKAEITSSSKKASAEVKGASMVVRAAFDATLLGSDLMAKVLLRRSAGYTTVRELHSQDFSQTTTVIRQGQRAAALGTISDWIGQSTTKFLKIADPYVGPDEVALVLQMVLTRNPELEVSFLTSEKHQTYSEDQAPRALYRREWKKCSDQEPPSTQVVIAGVKGSKGSPIHDRWMLTHGGGLRLGSSLNSIGAGSDSEISVLGAGESEDKLRVVDEYLSQLVKVFKNEKIAYDSFTL